MKRLTAIFFSLTLALGLAACGSSASSAAQPGSSSPVSSEAVSSEASPASSAATSSEGDAAGSETQSAGSTLGSTIRLPAIQRKQLAISQTSPAETCLNWFLPTLIPART